MGRAGADQAGSELVQVGLAHRDSPGGDQMPDDMGGALRGVRKGRAGGGGGDALQVDVVLDREGDAVEGQVLGVGPGQAVQIVGLFGLREDMDPDGIVPMEVEAAADVGQQGGGAQVTGQVAGTQVADGQVRWLVRHGAGRSVAGSLCGRGGWTMVRSGSAKHRGWHSGLGAVTPPAGRRGTECRQDAGAPGTPRTQYRQGALTPGYPGPSGSAP